MPISIDLSMEIKKIGVTGFEPATSASRTQRSTKLSHTPKHGSYYNTKNKIGYCFFYFFVWAVSMIVTVQL